MTQSFPKTVRLLKRNHFRRMEKADRRYVGKWVVIEKRQSASKQSRLGITVTKRYGKAHERNRFKRIVREAFRLCRKTLPHGQDIHIRPRPIAKQAKTQDIIHDLMH